MNKEREDEIKETIQSYKHTEVAKLLLELLSLRRERFRDNLESGEDPLVRGRAKECKDLIHILS